MKTIIKFTIFTVLISVSYLSVAEILLYPFEDQVKEERFNVLIQELRCPKCQNNNLADSNATLAVDLKDIVYEQIKEGKSDEEVTNYLKARYGDFISYRPPVKPSTWLIWYGPFVALLVGAFLIFRFVSARQKNKPVTFQSVSSESSKELLDQWSNEATSDSITRIGDSK